MGAPLQLRIERPRNSAWFGSWFGLVWLGLAWCHFGFRIELPPNPAYFGPWFGLVWPGFALAPRWFSRGASLQSSLVWPLVWLGLAWFRFGSSVVFAWSFLAIQHGLVPGLAWFGLVSLWLLGGFRVELPQNPAWFGLDPAWFVLWFGLVWPGFLLVCTGTSIFGRVLPFFGASQLESGLGLLSAISIHSLIWNGRLEASRGLPRCFSARRRPESTNQSSHQSITGTGRQSVEQVIQECTDAGGSSPAPCGRQEKTFPSL